MQSCHLTDPSHPHHVEAGASDKSTPQECPGSLLIVQRELRSMADDDGVVTPESYERYLKRRRRGITRRGMLFWVVQRCQFGDVPIVGERSMPLIPEDQAIGLPAYLRES
jgi:hypothetical protein